MRVRLALRPGVRVVLVCLNDGQPNPDLAKSASPGLPALQLGGGVRIDTPVILAPMSGVTDLPFRRLARALGAGLVVSEMIASWAMLRENRTTLRMAELDSGRAVRHPAGRLRPRRRWPRRRAWRSVAGPTSSTSISAAR